MSDLEIRTASDAAAREILLAALENALQRLDAVALALGMDLPEDDHAFRSDLVADCLLDHARAVMKRVENAERDVTPATTPTKPMRPRCGCYGGPHGGYTCQACS